MFQKQLIFSLIFFFSTMAKRDIMIGPIGEKLYQDLESIEFDIREMFPEIIVTSVEKVAESMSCPPVYITNSLLGVLASCMGSAVVAKSDTHTEPVVLWNLSLGMKGTAKVSIIFVWFFWFG